MTKEDIELYARTAEQIKRLAGIKSDEHLTRAVRTQSLLIRLCVRKGALSVMAVMLLLPEELGHAIGMMFKSMALWTESEAEKVIQRLGLDELAPRDLARIGTDFNKTLRSKEQREELLDVLDWLEDSHS